MTRAYRYAASAFSLIEMLAAVAIVSMLLVGLTMTISQLRSGLDQMPWRGSDGALERAVTVMALDCRGMVHCETLPTEQSEHGVALAMFTTTHRLDALEGNRWLGSARVGYWSEDTVAGGRALWRSESTGGEGGSSTHWARLLGDLQRIEYAQWRDGEWQAWPQSDGGREVPLHTDTPAVRIQLRRGQSAAANAWSDHEVILPTMNTRDKGRASDSTQSTGGLQAHGA